MSINQLGFYHGSTGLLERALTLYRQVSALKPDHFIGYFNQACVLALMGRLDESLDALSEIPRNAGASASIRETLEELAHDPDFNNLIADGRRSQKFRGIELELFHTQASSTGRTVRAGPTAA
jgi:tetratricopeptide (TPR) repeat protein